MSIYTDPAYLCGEQYRDDSQLSARIALHRRFCINPYPWFRWVFDQLLAAAPQARVLEVGCGPAWLWQENADRIPAGWEVILSDFSPGMTAKARSNLAPAGHPCHFCQIDAQAIPFPAAVFDVVIANHMLYHLPDRAQALAEMRRVLKPGGVLFAALSGDAHMAELDELLHQVTPHLGHPRNERELSGITLETAAAEFVPWFTAVSVRSYTPNGLAVTEIEPVIAYIRSMHAASRASATDLERLRQHIAAEIAAHGAMHITRSTGLVIAHN